MKKILSIVPLLVLAACGERAEFPRVDVEERRELFMECMKLLPPTISSKEGAVKECNDYAVSIAWGRARDRQDATQAEHKEK